MSKKYQMYIYVQFSDFESYESIEVDNPETEKIIGIIPKATKEETIMHPKSTEIAFKERSVLPAQTIAEYLIAHN